MSIRSAVADLNHAVPCGYARGIGAGLALLPARVVLDRNPGGAYLSMLIAAARLISRQALTALALSHGHDTAF